MKPDFIKIEDLQPAYGEEVLIIKYGDIRTIQVAKFNEVTTNSGGRTYLFYDGNTSSIAPSHWLPKSVLSIKE